MDGMKSQEELDSWAPALAHTDLRRLSEGNAGKTLLRVLEICSGCGSVSTAAGKEAREHFGIADVEVFSVDGKPGTNASRVVDMLTYDELLRNFRHMKEEGVRYVYYAHASPPCGPYSAMSYPSASPLSQRNLRWGDSVAQRCLELMHWFQPDYWTVESKGPPGLNTRPFMPAMNPLRCTVNYCRYGWHRWKRTSIWTNVRTWMPEPRCLCKPPSCCAHFLEYGKHLDRVQTAASSSPSFAALPEMLVRAWTHAALTEIGLFHEAWSTTTSARSTPGAS